MNREGNAGRGLSGLSNLRMKKAASESNFAGMSTGLVRSASGRQLSGMVRSSSGRVLSALAAPATGLHQEAKWEESGGWKKETKNSRLERDASMVTLLNLVDPKSLVDTKQSDDNLLEQHSALSFRGVAMVGGASALVWQALRLFLRDLAGVGGSESRKRDVLEMHALSTLHSFGWVLFLARKLFSHDELPKYCSRALVVSLGYYIQDCWNLRGTLLNNPAMLVHQLSVATSIASILRSKGVAWLAPPLMSLSVPTLVQELLQLCGTIGLPATRPEVRGLRLAWFATFAMSKLALVPLWLRHHSRAELHQPNLFVGKAGYLVGLALNVQFLIAAARDLPSFLRPKGAVVPAAVAYRVPMKGINAAGTSIAGAVVLGTIFGSYLSAPVAAILGFLAFRRGSSRRLKALAAALCSLVAVDQLTPQPRQCSPLARLFLPLFRKALKVFNFKVYPENRFSDMLRADRHYMIAVTPHGFFPWGAGAVIVQLLSEGYLPNLVAASVLGHLPVAGRILRIIGFQAATRPNIRRCLQKEFPRNVTVILPGGIKEMFCLREDIELSASNLHKGFVDLAVEGGAMLVPGFLLGVSQQYQVARGALGKFFEGLSRRLQASLNLFTGRWGTLLPYPGNMACACGEPIDTRVIQDPNEVHRIWMERLRSAFDEHKADFGWPDRQLYFLGEKDIPPPPEDILEQYTALPKLSKL